VVTWSIDQGRLTDPQADQTIAHPYQEQYRPWRGIRYSMAVEAPLEDFRGFENLYTYEIIEVLLPENTRAKEDD